MTRTPCRGHGALHTLGECACFHPAILPTRIEFRFGDWHKTHATELEKMIEQEVALAMDNLVKPSAAQLKLERVEHELKKLRERLAEVLLVGMMTARDPQRRATDPTGWRELEEFLSAVSNKERI